MRNLFATSLLSAMMLAPALLAGDAATDIAHLKARIAALERKLAELEPVLAPLRAELAAKARQAKLQPKVKARLDQDAKAFKPEELAAIEKLYAAANANWSGIQAADQVAALQQQFPRANLTGCALLKLAETARGDERQVFLALLVKDYGDCWFKDGVQTGAYARFLLVQQHLEAKRTADARKIATELREQYPDAVNHDGLLLSDLLPKD